VTELAPKTPLEGYRQTIGGITIEALKPAAITFIALANSMADVMPKSPADIERSSGIADPAPGRSTATPGGGQRLVWTAADQRLLIAFEPATDLATNDLHLTDVSDAWVVARIAGAETVSGLAYLCSLDLDETVFPPGSAARTPMAHITTILIRESSTSFLLMIPSTFADGMRSALERAFAIP
jgi:sarcosine oxidase subunit gamma